MKVLEATAESCMKALEKILSEQEVYELVSRAAEVMIEVDGNTEAKEIVRVASYIQKIAPANAEVIFWNVPEKMQGGDIKLILTVKEREKKSLVEKIKMFKEKVVLRAR